MASGRETRLGPVAHPTAGFRLIVWVRLSGGGRAASDAQHGPDAIEVDRRQPHLPRSLEISPAEAFGHLSIEWVFALARRVTRRRRSRRQPVGPKPIEFEAVPPRCKNLTLHTSRPALGAPAAHRG